MSWIVVADASRCQIYEFSGKTHSLHLIDSIENEAARQKRMDLVTDRPGQYKARDTAYGAYQPSSDPKTVSLQHYLHEVASYLNQGRMQHAYDELTLIAADRMMGYLNNGLDKHVLNLVSHHIQKDLMALKPHELEALLIEKTRHPSSWWAS